MSWNGEIHSTVTKIGFVRSVFIDCVSLLADRFSRDSYTKIPHLVLLSCILATCPAKTVAHYLHTL
jgi:hypothetical protein